MAVIGSVSQTAVQARKLNVNDDLLQEINRWTLQAAFSTLTNVNFSSERITEYAKEGLDLQRAMAKKINATPMIDWTFDSDMELEELGHTVSVPNRAALMKHEDAFALKELGTYGLKGVCAYAAHCLALGKEDENVYQHIHELFATLSSDTPSMETFLQAALDVGKVNTTVLAMLDDAHASVLGAPEPSPARTTAVEGKCILVSGHDMMDLHELLKQTEGTGINVYTHGEMLPAHAYPKLKAFPHLVGNYGTAWQNQKFEFAGFPGPILVTTNCIQEPRRVYRDRLYTINEVGVDGVQHIENRDFSALIAQARQLKGFPRTLEPAEYLTTGFNHRVVVPLAGTVLKAVEAGDLKRIFLIGGCDGSQWDRSYFTQLAEEAPSDTLILTMGCAKNRLIHSKKLKGAMLGNTGLPRVLDMGQCNDAYSAVVVALELAKALNCTVNDLPLSLAVSHLEQKAAAVLLTLLSLGVKNIRLGPSLPAYLTPNVLKTLNREYNLMPTGDAQSDLEMMMQGK